MMNECNFESEALVTVIGEATGQEQERMTELINLQKSSGILEISPENWTVSVLENILNFGNEQKKCKLPKIDGSSRGIRQN